MNTITKSPKWLLAFIMPFLFINIVMYFDLNAAFSQVIQVFINILGRSLAGGLYITLCLIPSIFILYAVPYSRRVKIIHCLVFIILVFIFALISYPVTQPSHN